jgi:L-threonylcarbamoyladenylate synthase
MASPFAIRHAAHQIRHGGVIIYPTDTVYGLGCDPMNSDAVDYLNTLKQRNPDKGLILIANKLEYFSDYIKELNQEDQVKVKQTKTPTSWIVPAKESTPLWLTGNNQTLAIRITQHPIVSELCNQLHHPLVSSSANPNKKKPAVNALQLHKYFHDKVYAMLVADNEHDTQPSSIRILDNNLMIRP